MEPLQMEAVLAEPPVLALAPPRWPAQPEGEGHDSGVVWVHPGVLAVPLAFVLIWLCTRPCVARRSALFGVCLSVAPYVLWLLSAHGPSPALLEWNLLAFHPPPAVRAELEAFGPRMLLTSVCYLSTPYSLNGTFGLWDSPYALWVWFALSPQGRRLGRILGIALPGSWVLQLLTALLLPYWPLADVASRQRTFTMQLVAVYCTCRQVLHAFRLVENIRQLHLMLKRDAIEVLWKLTYGLLWYYVVWLVWPITIWATHNDWDKTTRDAKGVEFLLQCLLPVLLAVEPAAIAGVARDTRRDERWRRDQERQERQLLQQALAQRDGVFELQIGFLGWRAQARRRRRTRIRARSTTPPHWPPPIAMTDAERDVLSNRVPDALKCKITRDVMTEPAVVNGHSYNRPALQEWLSLNNVDPMTRKAVSPQDVMPAHNIRALVEDCLAELRHSYRDRPGPATTDAAPASPPSPDGTLDVDVTATTTSPGSDVSLLMSPACHPAPQPAAPLAAPCPAEPHPPVIDVDLTVAEPPTWPNRLLRAAAAVPDTSAAAAAAPPAPVHHALPPLVPDPRDQPASLHSGEAMEVEVEGDAESDAGGSGPDPPGDGGAAADDAMEGVDGPASPSRKRSCDEAATPLPAAQRRRLDQGSAPAPRPRPRATLSAADAGEVSEEDEFEEPLADMPDAATEPR